jgi:hypothetical protein
MILTTTQKIYLFGTLIYLISLTGVLSVFQPTNSTIPAISGENQIKSNSVKDYSEANVKDVNSAEETILPVLFSQTGVYFVKLEKGRINGYTKF